MIGEIIKSIATHSLAFTAGGVFGILYASNQYNEDPNKIFNKWSDDAHDAISSIKNHDDDEDDYFDDIETVTGEVVK